MLSRSSKLYKKTKFKKVGTQTQPLSSVCIMAEIEPILRIGCTVLVASARFDESNEDRWSVAKFGAEANTKQLVCEVVS